MARTGEIIVGLDVGTTKVVAAVGEVREDHTVDIIGVGMSPSHGIKKGVVVGKTTKDGVWVDESPFDVGHLFHTVFAALGINSKKVEYKNNGQPLPIAREDCEPIKEVLA